MHKWAKQKEGLEPTFRDLKGFVTAGNELPEGFDKGSLPQLDLFCEHISTKTYVLWAKTYNLKWSFYVFHSLNDMGLPLTDVDKLKAHVLDHWTTQESQAKHAAVWDESMAMAGAEQTFEHVLRHVATAHGMEGRVSLLDYMVTSRDDAFCPIYVLP